MICKVDLESIDKIKSITVPAAVTADTDLFFFKNATASCADAYRKWFSFECMFSTINAKEGWKMKLQDKLVQLRKKKGLSQLELAEALKVSRQAISKWELGTAIPTLENLASISRLFGVSVDYLVDDEAESDFDTPAAKAAENYYKTNYKRTVISVIVTAVAVIFAIIIGIINHSVFTSLLFLLLIGTAIVIYLVIHWLYRNAAYKDEEKRR